MENISVMNMGQTSRKEKFVHTVLDMAKIISLQKLELKGETLNSFSWEREFSLQRRTSTYWSSNYSKFNSKLKMYLVNLYQWVPIQNLKLNYKTEAKKYLWWKMEVIEQIFHWKITLTQTPIHPHTLTHTHTHPNTNSQTYSCQHN